MSSTPGPRHPHLVALGARSGELREATGLSQESFAAAVGLDRTYYGGIERGERNVAGLNLIRIALILGVEVGGSFHRWSSFRKGMGEGEAGPRRALPVMGRPCSTRTCNGNGDPRAARRLRARRTRSTL